MRSFRSLALAALLALASGGALAQGGNNTTCPPRPLGDSTNACANTAFVQTAIPLGTIPYTSITGLPANTFLGNNTGSPANAIALTATQATAGLNLFTSGLQGLVPASGGGTTNFLRADGTFAAVSSAGTVTSVSAGTGITNTPNPITATGSVALTVPVVTANGGTGVVSPATHTLPINQGASAQTNTGTGTTGQGVISNGAAADPSFKSGPWTLLNTLTASNSATLGDTTSITATYADYEIVFENILPATNTVSLNLQVHASAAFQNTSYVTSSIGSNGGGAFGSGVATTTAITLMQVQGNAGPGISGTISVYAPTGSSTPKQWNGTFSGNTTTPTAVFEVAGGYWNNNTALDGFQVLMSAGNITSGTIKIYGRL